ncbi:hypothetical protein AAVH_14252 [Aphelenchoides avenae]|nr:hypothetical protein AAVH_14252 [Aphelenchus avenae]
MPELTASDLALLYGSLDEEQHVEDLLSDKFQAMLTDTDLEADQPTAEPTPRPADNAGTEGGTSTAEADNATAGAGTTGQAEVVPSIPPPSPGTPSAPRAASTSQSDSDARSRQHSTKRSHPHTADSRDPPAQRLRRHISVFPERLSPGIERHRRTRRDTDKPLSPILDPRVYKDSAALLTLRTGPFEQWTQEFRNADSEYLGYVNAHTVPWTYLPPEAYNHQPLRKAHHSLGELTLDDVLKEDERLPNRYVLGHSFGIDRKLHKMVNSETRQYMTFIALQ